MVRVTADLNDLLCIGELQYFCVYTKVENLRSLVLNLEGTNSYTTNCVQCTLAYAHFWNMTFLVIISN